MTPCGAKLHDLDEPGARMRTRVTSKGRNYWSTRCRGCYNLKCQRAGEKYRAARRARFLEVYGGECRCCGEQAPVFLCLDHVQDDGAEDRRRETGSRTQNYHVYLRAIKEYRPDIYQILCWNCNAAKAAGMPCPHTLEQET